MRRGFIADWIGLQTDVDHTAARDISRAVVARIPTVYRESSPSLPVSGTIQALHLVAEHLWKPKNELKPALVTSRDFPPTITLSS
jgi:hypothetical protein